MNQRRLAVALIVSAQWLGTSLWFSPNSAADDLMAAWLIGPAQFAWLIAATQSGFIAGTLLLAYSGWADRYSTSRIFAMACVSGAIFNGVFSAGWTGFESGLALRFADRFLPDTNQPQSEAEDPTRNRSSPLKTPH